MDDLVTVDWANSGSGTVTLLSHKPQKDVKIGDVPDPNHPYNDKYVMLSTEALGDVRIVYEAAGSMPMGTTFKVTMVGICIRRRQSRRHQNSVRHRQRQSGL